jgi:hypothetical protein
LITRVDGVVVTECYLITGVDGVVVKNVIW